ncbi:hypothetical protein IW262DRAFT_582170 [Armillaria fumosa]|nr:hypothetical protein IW262DRAFT_582170 [Armillaria fumosa]
MENGWRRTGFIGRSAWDGLVSEICHGCNFNGILGAAISGHCHLIHFHVTSHVTRLSPFLAMLPSCKSTASLLYHIARNSRGSLPVYSDIRNGGTRHLVLIRNVDGNLSALANDITTSLLNNDPSAKVSIARNRHLVIRAHGLVSKNQIAQWLAEKGF